MSIKGIGAIVPILQFEDGTGVPYASGSLTFYAISTSNLQDVYSDVALTTPLPNPVPLNAAGRTSTTTTGTDSPVYLGQGNYDITLKDSTGTIIWGPISLAGSQWPGQVQGISTISPVANANGYANRFTTTINKASSGTHSLFAGTRFDIPTIGAGASTLTESATVYIEGPPATGTLPLALHVASGNVQIDGNLTVNGQLYGGPHYKAKTADYTALAYDLVSATSGTFTITLPAASANANATIWTVNNGTGVITVGKTGSDTVGLASSQTLNAGASSSVQGDSLTFISDGVSNWIIV